METWRVLAGAALCLAMSLVGVGLATNFRGMTEWHVRRSTSTASGSRRLPHEERIARFILLERVMGVAIAVVGLVALVDLVYNIMAGWPMRMVK
ncbi:hypothetical protein AB0E12_13570 [Micromonospora chersina]|uniref:hypothetical protein n=1 Tax=Micromonospora chersina TaxID=47854 RepID=UPI0033E4E782